MTPKQIDTFFARLKAINPAPQTELFSTNPFTLLVAVVLSAQTTDAGVNKATPALFKLADTPKKMLALGEDKVKDLIKTIGLFNGKAKNIIALSKMLLEKHGGELPRTREELQELPGVGRKTANVLLNAAFGEPTMAVDTHVFRVANRTGMASGKTPEQVEEGLLKVIPKKYMQHAHHWLILHGRYTCKARAPLCGECTVRDVCGFQEKN
jgi:endonuclease-3